VCCKSKRGQSNLALVTTFGKVQPVGVVQLRWATHTTLCNSYIYSAIYSNSISSVLIFLLSHVRYVKTVLHIDRQHVSKYVEWYRMYTQMCCFASNIYRFKGSQPYTYCKVCSTTYVSFARTFGIRSTQPSSVFSVD
jgi:hypothetical protein